MRVEPVAPSSRLTEASTYSISRDHIDFRTYAKTITIVRQNAQG